MKNKYRILWRSATKFKCARAVLFKYTNYGLIYVGYAYTRPDGSSVHVTLPISPIA